ncbi:hypothetical protein [Burkholderia multivorans]|jgi:hypothetical protein|uniref:hypothetical protein n=1 Tax=Burkholderia multivorans TaxID=87883 RepID=UPI0021BE7EA3|nr:hypothetical protein [Burkholderia multivorans]MDR9051039.1 hypothetical protein [Burkholderia multivorans]MDR9060400.1 hypothetical protein [Burkholderia multivorans]MDR9062677.1 hypothetical protein [Burkholderia multivorans]MDR9078052.1 hypothetical protein [Burkholderia multivorans]MDR9093545.1 hypothetical protein [Burkholderia multivorans]
MAVALHRMQDLSAASAEHYAKETLEQTVSTYLEWRDPQIDAIEDGNTQLASSIGRSMKGLRERFDQAKWAREIARQDP